MSGAAKKIDNNFDFFEEELTKKQYEYFATLMYDLSGVNLPHSAKNVALVKNRLTKLNRRLGVSSYDDLIAKLKNADQQLTSDFISSLTTNKTHFFREEAHFDWLKDYLKTHFNNHNELRLWCAASSTGQEPYTIAMVIRETLQAHELMKVKLLGTDIDLQCLNKSAKGQYLEGEMDGCPGHLREKYFEKHRVGNDLVYRAKDDVAKMWKFAQLNLIQDKYPFQNKFHIIFCRNVLIYFDPPTVKKVIENMASQLVEGGFLILGHSESGTVKSNLIKPLSRAIYQRV